MDAPILINPSTESPNRMPEGPWWAKFATIFGVPALLALYFAWALVSGQGTILSNIERMLYAQQSQVAEVATIARETAATTTAVSLRIELYMRQICVNSAKTPVERNTCLSIR